ncbi:MAG: glycosyltransferase family 9 protein [Planctomycetes bacterium]|nr:glycosyltransferase family 9 protein [Planctomycetota bacterium]
MPNWLGDCVMAMPALRHLSDVLPDADIYLAGRENFRSFFSAQPGVAGFVPAPEKGFGNILRGISETTRIIQGAGIDSDIDVGLLLTNSLSTAAWMWRTGARHRIGYDLDCRRFFLTRPVPFGGVEKTWHCIRSYLWLAKMAETVTARENDGPPAREVHPLGEYLIPSVSVGDDARAEAAALVKAAGIGDRYAVIAPASAYGAVKDWPPDHYRDLVVKLRREFDCPVIVTGGGGQYDTAEHIAAGLTGVHNLAGRTNLDCFVGLLAGACLFVGVDSGGAHVSAALGLPTVVIFGITNPSRTRPTGHRVVTIGDGEDRDVKLSTPEAREAAKRVLQAISPDAVLEAARKASAPVTETATP